eukprot:scaffold60150_cov21-Prasinocladus_malaysianus.AAC.2
MELELLDLRACEGWMTTAKCSSPAWQAVGCRNGWDDSQQPDHRVKHGHSSGLWATERYSSHHKGMRKSRQKLGTNTEGN